VSFLDRLPSGSPRGIRNAIRAGCPSRETGPDLHFCSVGVAGFEPTASSSRTKRATKLRHTPSVPSNGSSPDSGGKFGIPHQRERSRLGWYGVVQKVRQPLLVRFRIEVP
jgi:hypothetical protein